MYRPGKENAAADSLTRGFCSSTSISSLAEIHASLCHPGVTRLLHFVRTKNLLFSTGDVRKVCSSCHNLCTPITLLSFSSGSIKEFLLKGGIASSKSSPYHPTGNSQAERYIGIVRKSIRLSLKSNNLPLSCWETVLPNALHSIRSLLNTTTNTTPHELFFNFNRRSRSGRSLPAWLFSPGPVMLRKFLRNHKNDDLVEEVQLLDANPQYANIRYRDGRESSVSLSDLSPCPQGLNSREIESRFPILDEEDPQTSPVQQGKDDLLRTTPSKPTMQRQSGDAPPHQHENSLQQDDQNSFLSAPSEPTVRRSTGSTKGVPPIRYGEPISH